jgi:phage baseplate assembly protein W
MEIDVTGTLEEIEIGAIGVSEIVQNVRTILSTIKGTVPLDRAFGVTGEYIDLPQPAAQALFAAEIVDEVEKQEPRVKVTSLSWQQSNAEAMDGKLVPVVRIRIKEGIL